MKFETILSRFNYNFKFHIENKFLAPSPRHPFIRAQTVNLVIGNDAILPIKEEEEPDLEEALQEAKEVECPSASFAVIVENPRAGPPHFSSFHDPPQSDVALHEKSHEFDDVMTNDENRKMGEKRKQRSKRAASEDSGISSTSTFVSALRGRERNPSASNSDYCGDSEDYVGNDIKNHGAESFQKEEKLDDVNFENDTTKLLARQ